MKSPATAVIVLWTITILSSANGFSFVFDWLDVIWVLTLIVFSSVVIWKIWKAPNKYCLLPLGLFILLLIIAIRGGYRPIYVYVFDGTYRVKVYYEITGFMDSGTRFVMYDQISVLPFLERETGTAINWNIDYISSKPLPEIKLLEKSLIVTKAEKSDTLLINFENFLFK